jgi:hypothetical protein
MMLYALIATELQYLILSTVWLVDGTRMLLFQGLLRKMQGPMVRSTPNNSVLDSL